MCELALPLHQESRGSAIRKLGPSILILLCKRIESRADARRVTEDILSCDSSNIPGVADIAEGRKTKYVAYVTKTSENKPDWLIWFETAIRGMRDKPYDFKGLASGKAENAITGLIAHEMMMRRPDSVAYIEIPASSKKDEDSGNRKSDRGGGEKPDLFVMKKDAQDWKEPEVYAEFKFYFSQDIESTERDGFAPVPLGCRNIDHKKEFLGDLRKLHSFKAKSPKTVCVQGFYLCCNPKAKYGEKASGNKPIEHFINSYGDLPSLKQARLESKSSRKSSPDESEWFNSANLKLTKNILKFSDWKWHELSIVDDKNFWLSLILFEIVNQGE